MSIGFFIVGGTIFACYVALTLWVILSQNRKQREEGNGTRTYYSRHADPVDMDGHGNWGRFPAENRSRLSPEVRILKSRTKKKQ